MNKLASIRYDINKLRHIGQGCVYFYSGDSMEHLTDYVRREETFGVRVLPILVVDRDCRMYVDCPLYSPWEWIPKMISVSPPERFGFNHQDVLEALKEITAENDRVKEWIACDLVMAARISKDDRLAADGAVTSALKRFIGRARRLTRDPRDRDDNTPYRLRGGRPVASRYMDEPVMVVPYRYDGDVIPFEKYKAWEAEEAKKGVPDEERLPLEFRASLSALEMFLKDRGVTSFDIVNFETLRT